jgi:hypothetical protein
MLWMIILHCFHTKKNPLEWLLFSGNRSSYVRRVENLSYHEKTMISNNEYWIHHMYIFIQSIVILEHMFILFQVCSGTFVHCSSFFYLLEFIADGKSLYFSWILYFQLSNTFIKLKLFIYHRSFYISQNNIPRNLSETSMLSKYIFEISFDAKKSVEVRTVSIPTFRLIRWIKHKILVLYKPTCRHELFVT